MNFVTVKLSYDYADEFQVEALWLTTGDEFISFLEELEKRDISEFYEVPFGTNEFFFFDDLEAITNALTTATISESTFNEMYDALDGAELGLISIPGLLDVYPLKEEDE